VHRKGKGGEGGVSSPSKRNPGLVRIVRPGLSHRDALTLPSPDFFGSLTAPPPPTPLLACRGRGREEAVTSLHPSLLELFKQFFNLSDRHTEMDI